MSNQERVASGNFQINQSLGDGKSISISGYLFSDDNLSDVNTRIDMANAALDRQRKKNDVILILKHIEGNQDALKRSEEQLDLLSAMKDNGGRLATQERTLLDSLPNTIKGIKESVAKGVAEVEKLLKEIDA
jgi:hypothetical protein